MEKISWRSLEYKKRERTTDWYWSVIILAISISIISIILKDYSFLILIILSTILIIIYSTKNPSELKISINRRGIIVENKMYPFATLEAFWIDTSEEENHKIILKSQKVIMPLVIIPVKDSIHLEVRDILLENLPEKEMHEPLSQKVMDKLGF